MTPQFKARKCKNRRCRKDFPPRTEWQKYCSIRCRSAVLNRRNSALIKKAKLMELASRATPTAEEGQ